MGRRENTGILYSDWSGTAVEEAGARVWQLTKPELRKGYLEFLRGAEEVGLEFKGVATGHVAIRKPITRMALRHLAEQHPGFSDTLWQDPYRFFTGGSQLRKATHVLEGSIREHTRAILLDDEPQRIGPVLIQAMRDRALARGDDVADVTLAVAPHPDQYNRLDEFFDHKNTPHDYELDQANSTYTYQLGHNAVFHLAIVDHYTELDGARLAYVVKQLPLAA